MKFQTFTGKVQEVKEFGKAVKLTLVSLPGKDSGYEPQYVDCIWKADSWQAKLALTLKKDDDDITVAGRAMKKKWTNGNGYSEEMPFPELRVPWAIRGKKNEAPVPAKTARKPAAQDDLDDLPF